MKNAVIFIAIFQLFILSCTKKQVWKPRPPVPGLETPYEVFRISADSGKNLSFPGGTTVSVPPLCFTDSLGNIVKGMITIRYREFHQATDILLSGIPMEFTSVGEKRFFNTAGMFEIRADQDNRSLEIAPGKNIGIRFGSKYNGQEYSFFYLNDQGKWEFADYPETQVNEEKTALREKLKKTFSALPFPLRKDYFVFNYEWLLDVYLNYDREKFYKNRNNKDIRKKLEAYGMKMFDVQVYGEVQFGNAYYHPAEMLWKEIDRGDFPKWTETFQIDWQRINNKWEIINYSLTKMEGKTYKIWLRGDKNRTFTKRMEMVMPLAKLLKMPASKWEEQYRQLKDKIEKEEKQIDLMAETYRVISINRMGAYNFDKLMKQDNWFSVNAGYVDSEKRSPLQTDVFIIFGDNSGYYQINAGKYAETMINPPSGHKIFSILPDKTLAVYPAGKLSAMASDSLRSQSDRHYTFELDKTTKIENAVQFRQLLGFEK